MKNLHFYLVKGSLRGAFFYQTQNKLALYLEYGYIISIERDNNRQRIENG